MQEKLFKALVCLRVLVLSPMPITGTLAIKEELYLKPNKKYAYSIPGGLLEFGLHLNQKLDPDATEVFFQNFRNGFPKTRQIFGDVRNRYLLPPLKISFSVYDDCVLKILPLEYNAVALKVTVPSPHQHL